MRIGIIGAGMIGGTLARRLAQLGHQIAIANSRGPETLRDLASDVGATAVTAVEAARSGEVVVITIPQRGVPELPSGLFAGVSADVVVIDTGNYYPSRDGRIPALEQGQPESAWVADQIGHPVIKAFNNIYFQSLLENGRPKGTPDRIALPVAGDPVTARAKVMRLVDELGFDPVDAGGIEDSWRQQPGTPCYTKDLDAMQLKAALTAAERSRVPDYRKAADDAAKEFFRTERDS
jgi:8-hydroxy-5-deazaflavin:NADPH oxidoreductase